MNIHLTDTELREFRSGKLSPDELLRADDHLADCSECRRRAASLNDATVAADDLRALLIDPTIHLSDEELPLFVAGRMPPEARDAARDHLLRCSTCARQVDELRSWLMPVVVARPRRRWVAIAAGAAAAVLIPAAIWQSSRTREPASLAGLDSLPPAEQARIRAALNAGVAPLPDFMADVAASREVLMGGPGDRTDTFALVSPVATGTVSDRPRFEWLMLAQADGYSVTIFDERSNVVAQSPAVTQTNWTPADLLTRDRTYVWQVTARRGRDSITAPAAPSPPARFHVIGAAQAEMLRREEAGQPQSHLLLGILNMDAGIHDAAVRHLEQVKPDDPRADVARQSLKRLQELSPVKPAR